MGQKTNANIFRLGKTKTWGFKYYEKKSTESSLYSFNNLELEKFIFKLFKDNGFLITHCKIYSSESITQIIITYYNTFKTITLLEKINQEQKIKFVSNSKDLNYRKKRKFRKKFVFFKQNSKNIFLYNKIKHTKLLDSKSKIQRLKLINYYKTLKNIKKYKNINEILTNQFLESLFNTLILFKKKQGKFQLTFNQINKNTKSIITKSNFKFLQKSLIQLKKYKSNDFFKNGINLLFLYVIKNPYSNLLVYYIAQELKQLKKHNFFLRFVNTALRLFVKNTSSKIKAIKIIIKGRINAAPKARQKIINIGTGVPTLSINSNIEYSEETSFTSNGTLGIKVWTLKK